jgi:hypothetical protein
MRDTAFAERTRRELAGLGKRLHDAIEARSSVERRRNSALPTDTGREDREPARESQSIDDARTPFSRELGDAWVEVEPGIYVSR